MSRDTAIYHVTPQNVTWHIISITWHRNMSRDTAIYHVTAQYITWPRNKLESMSRLTRIFRIDPHPCTRHNLSNIWFSILCFSFSTPFFARFSRFINCPSCAVSGWGEWLSGNDDKIQQIGINLYEFYSKLTVQCTSATSIRISKLHLPQICR